MEARFFRALVLFCILAVVFGILERFWPSIPNQPRLRRGLGTDIVYWFFLPVVNHALVLATAAVLLLPFYLLLGRSLEINSILAGYGPVSKLPLWQQGLLVVFIGDFLGYWTHRINHRFPILWGYHAVHHSGEVIDWLTAVRVHPLNDVFSKGLRSVPIMLLGFSPLAADLYTPILSCYVAFIHANVPWHYGPFRFLLASPAFHRWHHEMDPKAWGKNYSGLFPIFDLIFGTYYLPVDKQPRDFGVDGEHIPDSFIGQMLYPFHYWKKLWSQHKAHELETES